MTTTPESPAPTADTSPSDMLLDEIIALRDRVAALEERFAPQPKGWEQLDSKILAFMRENRLWMTALVIGENIAADNGKVGGRLSALVARGAIELRKEEGRTGLYRARGGVA